MNTNNNGEAGRGRGEEGAGPKFDAWFKDCGLDADYYHSAREGWMACLSNGYKEMISASAEPQRAASGPIRAALEPGEGYRLLVVGDTVEASDELWAYGSGPWDPVQSWTVGKPFIQGYNPMRRALLGEAPPKAEKSPELTDEQKAYIRRCEGMRNTYNDPPPFPSPGATVQPQARPMKLETEVHGNHLVWKWVNLDGLESTMASYFPDRLAKEIAYRINSFEPPHQGEAT